MIVVGRLGQGEMGQWEGSGGKGGREFDLTGETPMAVFILAPVKAERHAKIPILGSGGLERMNGFH